jgi:O-6-methylguanine DNA methyltransferase
VLRHLPDISYGHTASYAPVAQLAGSPKAVRAVGTACATNPLPVVVPCHRVPFVLSVSDDGRGGADEAGGSGLSGLRHRARAVDGTLTVTSPPGGPTTVSVELPLHP